MRQCTGCREDKPLTEFYPKRGRGHGRAGHQSRCKTCAKVAAALWVRQNPVRHRANTARWARSNRETAARSVAKWSAANPAKRQAQLVARRAAKLKARAPWANSFFIAEIYDLARLRTQHTGVKHEVDHIVPLQSPIVCGLHVEANLQVIPSVLNRRKQNRVWPDMPAPAAEVRA